MHLTVSCRLHEKNHTCGILFGLPLVRLRDSTHCKNGIDEMIGQKVPLDLSFFDEKGGKGVFAAIDGQTSTYLFRLFQLRQQMSASAWEPGRDARKSGYKSR